MIDEVGVVVDALATELGVSAAKVRAARSLKKELGMDSIAAANVLFALEETFGVDLELDGADRLDSVDDIAAVVKRLIARRPGAGGGAHTE